MVLIVFRVTRTNERMSAPNSPKDTTPILTRKNTRILSVSGSMDNVLDLSKCNETFRESLVELFNQFDKNQSGSIDVCIFILQLFVGFHNYSEY
jgi:hypothetical protein